MYANIKVTYRGVEDLGSPSRFSNSSFSMEGDTPRLSWLLYDYMLLLPLKEILKIPFPEIKSCKQPYTH